MMKKVIKVNIANFLFTLEEEGFLILSGYLNEIEEYYREYENGREIVEGIEERIAELFIEKCGMGGVVGVGVTREVISILGRPQAFDQGEESTSYSSQTGKRRVAKKLYRDGENKILGGVCAGIARYSSIDKLLVRVLFLLLFIGFSLFGFLQIGGASFMFIAYILLWILIPEAKTVEQKAAMYGESIDLSNIEANVERAVKRAKREVGRGIKENHHLINRVADALRVIISLFLIVVSLSILAALSLIFLGIEVFQDVTLFSLLDYLNLGMDSTLLFKITVISFITLPFIGMLYGGLELLFRFKKRRVRFGLLLLFLWLLSLIATLFFSVKLSRPYWANAKERGELVQLENYDTLYLKFDLNGEELTNRKLLSANHSTFSLLCMDSREELLLFPSLKIVRERRGEARRVSYETTALSYSNSDAYHRAARELPNIEVIDSLIVVHPNRYSRERGWDGLYHELSLYLPKGVEVIVVEPIEHKFDRRRAIGVFSSN